MMDHDEQLLESVAVRRRRLLHALLFSHHRRRRRFDESMKVTLISAVLATLICAACIGYSFIINLFAAQQDRLSAPPGLGMGAFG